MACQPKYKILLVLLTPITTNGISKNVYSYLEAMDHTNIEFDVITAFRVDDITGARFKEFVGDIKVMNSRYKSTLRYVNQLRKLIKKNKYDIVHVHGNSATMVLEMLAASLGGCKIRIAQCHNTKGILPRAEKLMRPLFYWLCKVRFACGREAGEYLYGSRSFDIINNAQNIEALKYDEEKRKEYRKRYGLTENLVFGHVGMFNEQKNYPFLIEVFRHVYMKEKNARLLLVGDGRLREETEELIKKYDLQDAVILTGRVANVPDLLQAMDMMIFPSLYEGLPNVVIEWQIAGLPAVISDVITQDCAFTDLVHFVPLSNGAEAWADYILNVSMPNREESRKFVMKAAAEAGYDINENARWLNAKYESLIKEKK